MARRRRGPLGHGLERLSSIVTRWAGSSSAFGVAGGVILVWIVTGPLFHYSETWQLVINTGTTVVTFLMVLLIQRSQNKESLVAHARHETKVREIVGPRRGARP